MNELCIQKPSQCTGVHWKFEKNRWVTDHPYVATPLNNLAGLYYSQGKYDKAETMYWRALEIYEKSLGKDHPYVATSLNNLALLYYAQGKYTEAEPMYWRALEILGKIAGKRPSQYS